MFPSIDLLGEAVVTTRNFEGDCDGDKEDDELERSFDGDFEGDLDLERRSV